MRSILMAEGDGVVTRREALRRLTGGLLALPLLAGAAGGLVAPGPAPARARPRGRGLAGYRIEASLDVDGAGLEARQVVSFRNGVGKPLESVVFRTVPGAWGRFVLAASRVDGGERPARLDGSILEIPLAAPLADGAAVEIELRYAIRLPREAGRLSATPRAVALGNWFPILTVHRGDWDRRPYVEGGDAFFSEVADYDVTLTTGRPLVVAATGRVVEREGTRSRFAARSVRDFALAAGDWAVHSVPAGDDTTVGGYARTPEKARLFAESGAAFVRRFGGRLGAYPYPHLAIAEVDLPASYGGMEYPGLVMLAAQLAPESPFAGSGLEVLLGHEIAHQWFYSWVGNDQFADPWLDEAFATYLPLLYYAEVRPDLYPAVRQRSLQGGPGGPPVDGGIADFASDGAYYATVYRKGARFLDALRERLGDGGFAALLREHVATHRDRLATPRAFLDRAQAATPANLGPLFAEFFRYPAFHYPAPQRWSLELPAIPWQGSADVFVGAEFPVTRVELWLDGRLLAGGPENAVTVDLAGVEPGEYVLLARVWNHEGTLFERSRRIEITYV